MTNFINMNKEIISLYHYKNGITQNIVIRLGHKLYYLDIEKNVSGAWLTLYPYNKNRKKVTKYGENCHMIQVKKDAYINRKLLENIKEIEKAQEIVWRYNKVLQQYR